MDWSAELDSLLEHPYDSPFLGELVHAERLRASAIQVSRGGAAGIAGADYIFHIGVAYAFKFGPRSHEDDDGRKNAYAVHIGSRILRIQSVMWQGDTPDIYKDVLIFEVASPEKLNAALAKFASLPKGRVPACCPNPTPFERRDLIDVIRKNA